MIQIAPICDNLFALTVEDDHRHVADSCSGINDALRPPCSMSEGSARTFKASAGKYKETDEVLACIRTLLLGHPWPRKEGSGLRRYLC